MKLPAFQFYPGDWMKDPSLRSCSLEARGLWMDMLCLMFESPVRGELRHANGKPITEQQLSRICGVEVLVIQNASKELAGSGVWSTTDDGAIASRRMVKDESLREVRRKAGKMGGNPALLNQNTSKTKPKDKNQVNQIPTPSSSSSSSVHKTTTNNSTGENLHFLAQSFPMHEDWFPSENFHEYLLSSGVTEPWVLFHDEFVLYWTGQPQRRETQSGWDSKFLKSIKRAIANREANLA